LPRQGIEKSEKYPPQKPSKPLRRIAHMMRSAIIKKSIKNCNTSEIPDREAIDVAAWIRFIREMKIPKIFSNISDARLPGKSHYKTAGTSNKLSRQCNKLLKEEKSIFYLVYLILN